MHQDVDLLSTLTAGLVAALLLGFGAKRIGLSPIVGYLVAGIALGPATPGIIADRHAAEQLAEIGVVLLMFGVGLHFHFKELLAVRKIAIPGAVVQSLVATELGTVVGLMFGWTITAGLVFGLATSVASTVVLTRVLIDNQDLHTPTGHISVGWLVVEDIFTVIILVTLPVLAANEQASLFSITWALGLAAAKMVAFTLLVVLVGSRVLPWFLGRVAKTRSKELFTLAVLAIALGIAVLSAKGFGVSMALGAFMAGMVIGRSDFSLRAATEALPMRDAFAVLFFVSVGMLFDPQSLVAHIWLVVSTCLIVLVAKPLAAFGIVVLLRYPTRIALAVGIALAQIGEFSFILATLSDKLGLSADGAGDALIAAAILSISINPLLYQAVGPVDRWLGTSGWLKFLAPPTGQFPQDDQDREAVPSSHRAVVIGYGPVGQTLCRLLKDNQVQPTIIEMNRETVNALRTEGENAVYGDAEHKATLEAAGVALAMVLIISTSGMNGMSNVIRHARELNPKIQILVRTNYLRERAALRKAGAHRSFSGEGEVALAMTEHVLERMGASQEQIDRQRERVRRELFDQANREDDES